MSTTRFLQKSAFLTKSVTRTLTIFYCELKASNLLLLKPEREYSWSFFSSPDNFFEICARQLSNINQRQQQLREDFKTTSRYFHSQISLKQSARSSFLQTFSILNSQPGLSENQSKRKALFDWRQLLENATLCDKVKLFRQQRTLVKSWLCRFYSTLTVTRSKLFAIFERFIDFQSRPRIVSV